jgi:hypothetical protein
VSAPSPISKDFVPTHNAVVEHQLGQVDTVNQNYPRFNPSRYHGILRDVGCDENPSGFQPGEAFDKGLLLVARTLACHLCLHIHQVQPQSLIFLMTPSTPSSPTGPMCSPSP